jgi:hypothetical protein
VLVRIPADVSRPASPQTARSMAMTAIERLSEIRATDATIAAWFAHMVQHHQQAIDRRVTRERALRDRAATPTAVQPGLFDRRALQAAEVVSATERAIAADHERRLSALERARELQLSSTAIAVLIVWR